MISYLSIIVGVLLVLTGAAAVEYYWQIRRAHREYEKAKGAVEDIILSVNRELKRESTKLETMEFNLAGNAGKTDTALKRMEILEKKILPLENQISNLSDSSEGVLTKITELNAKMLEIERHNETMNTKITDFEEQVQKFSSMPEIKIEPVIPIRRDKAMAPLTETEIAVLEMLSAEGPKTAPEIKEKVHLSREHTARLMKKLYEGGYLERETNKIPFRYSIKKEMEKLLRKPETTQL